MKLEDFNNIDPKNMGSLPLPVKVVILAFIFILIVFLGWYFLWDNQMTALNGAKTQELQLRDTFMGKKKEAVNLDAYKQQMADIEKTFGELLRQLPDKSQMDRLLTDINQTGLEAGLEFEQFKPGPELPAGFYVTKPISIKVRGNYHQLGTFAQNLGRLSLIVTLEDLDIVPGNDGRLGVSANVKTFRYIDQSESQSGGKK
ncbi:MAG: type 4a pilus biogenesis protein PilO [Methylobacillus sp.]|nr:type 4a pilus biogenesis protein PilO [Methylobacillus sp.]